MSFQHSLVFPFPAVQYIPLTITNVQQGPINHPTPHPATPQLIAGNDLITWESSLERDYGLKLPSDWAVSEVANPGGMCPFLAINLKIETVKYRSFFITMLGDYAPGQYQLFTIPTERLYKSKLMVELFDQSSGKRLVHQNLFWQPDSIPSRKAKNSR